MPAANASTTVISIDMTASGTVSVRRSKINPATGLRERDGASKTTEYFYAESQPPFGDDSAFARDGSRPPDEVRNQIF